MRTAFAHRAHVFILTGTFLVAYPMFPISLARTWAEMLNTGCLLVLLFEMFSTPSVWYPCHLLSITAESRATFVPFIKITYIYFWRNWKTKLHKDSIRNVLWVRLYCRIKLHEIQSSFLFSLWLRFWIRLWYFTKYSHAFSNGDWNTFR